MRTIQHLTLATTLALAISPAASADEKHEEDRAAILAMAGEYYVDFQFQETFSLDPDYKIKKPYNSVATETVKVIKDTGNSIIMQHLLFVPESGMVIKHWKQEWNFEDTDLNEFVGKNTWKHRSITPEQARGTWTQKVSQVDDSPRYESYGKWIHTENMSYWQSEPTQRPLPRREYTKRNDYTVLKCVNRHTITPEGWMHEQDNYKQVAPGKKVLCREVGLNVYEHTDDVDFTIANNYWNETKPFWEIVSAEFDRALLETPSLTLRDEIGGKPLYKQLFAAAKETKQDLAAGEERAKAIIRQFVIKES